MDHVPPSDRFDRFGNVAAVQTDSSFPRAEFIGQAGNKVAGRSWIRSQPAVITRRIGCAREREKGTSGCCWLFSLQIDAH